MTYNDELWEQALTELGVELGHCSVSYNGGPNDVSVKLKASVTTKQLLLNLDHHKGQPPEQIKDLISTQADKLIDILDESFGWPTVVKSYDEIEVHISICGKRAPDKVESGEDPSVMNTGLADLKLEGYLDGFYDPNMDLA